MRLTCHCFSQRGNTMPAPSPRGDETHAGVVDQANPNCPNATGQEGGTPVAKSGMSRLRVAASRLIRNPHFWVMTILLGLLAVCIVLATPYARAWYHLREARAEMQHWHNGQAIRHLQVCLEIWPRDPTVLLLAARSTRRARGYVEAERLLQM